MTLLLNPGSTEQFAELRQVLAASGYTMQGICDRMGIARLGDFQALGQGRETHIEINDVLDLLIRLFLDGQPVRSDAVPALLGERGWAVLKEVGLLVRDRQRDGHDVASVMLYPVESLYIVSDRLEWDTDGVAGKVKPAADVVYPAITSNTEDFLGDLPLSPCETILDLCSGTGIAALLAAPSVGHAWATDITERAMRFAEFNARLNDFHNVTALQGDLYEPVADLTFDRIVAHPPYVANATTELIYRDGGADGEQITRRIIEGLPRYLRMGGTFHCTCMATDRQGAPIEQRLRNLLGGDEAEFDVFVLARRALSPADYVGQEAVSGRRSFADAGERYEFYKRLEVERLVYVSILIRRHGAERPALTVRRTRGQNTGWEEIDWLVRWETLAATQAIDDELLSARPRLSSQVRLHIIQRMWQDGMAVEACRLESSYPFQMAIELPVGVGLLLQDFDGSRASVDLFHAEQAAGRIPPQVTVGEFVGLVRSLVAAGMLEIGSFPLPATGVRKVAAPAAG